MRNSYVLNSPWKVGIGEEVACNTGCYRRRPPVTPGVTGAVRPSHRELQGPIRGHKICFNQSECVQVQMRCNWRTAPVRTSDVRL